MTELDAAADMGYDYGYRDGLADARDRLEAWMRSYAVQFDAGSMTTDEDLAAMSVLADLRTWLGDGGFR